MMRVLMITALILMLFPPISGYTQEEDPPNVNWVHYYESLDIQGSNHWINDIFAIPGGGYAICGHVSLRANHHAGWLLVADIGGEVMVDRLFELENNAVGFVDCYSVIKTDDGGYLLGGRTQLPNGIHNFDVIKVDRNGEMLWWSLFGNGSGWGCHALIELKGGNYVAAGQNNDYRPYVVMIDNNGDAVWEREYNGNWLFGLREVADEGLLLAGYLQARTSWLVKTDFNGDVIWTNSFENGPLWTLISCPGGGFAASGQAAGGQGFGLCRVDNEGELMWRRNYIIRGNQDVAMGLAVLEDGGFVMSGRTIGDGGNSWSATIRTDAAGNERWRRLGDRLPIIPNDALARNYGSVVVLPDGSIVYGGNTRRVDELEESKDEGVIVCLEADRSAPNIVEIHPDTLFLTILTGDSTLFTVRAEDLQDDSLMYIWTLDNAEVSTDTFAVITFEESGLSDVKCVVSDGLLADSVMWRVEVRDFYISAYTPPQPNVIVRRNTYHNFGVEIEAIDGLELFVNWTFTGRDRRQLIIGHEDTLAVYFPFAGENHLSVSIQGNQEVETVDWDIEVSSPVWYWWPHELALTVPVDTVMDFVIFPFNPESDSLEYRWELDGEIIEDVEPETDINLDEIGAHHITAYVTEGTEADTIQWLLDVLEAESISGDFDKGNQPDEALLYPPSPNPFNNVVNISYYVPVTQEVDLAVYDLLGRLSEVLVQQTVAAGEYRVVFSANDLPSGYYLVRYECGDTVDMKKMLLLR